MTERQAAPELLTDWLRQALLDARRDRDLAAAPPIDSFHEGRISAYTATLEEVDRLDAARSTVPDRTITVRVANVEEWCRRVLADPEAIALRAEAGFTARATIEAMSGDAADLHDLMDEAAALRTALAHVLVRTHDGGCGTCDAARALLTADHELPSRALREPITTAGVEPGLTRLRTNGSHQSTLDVGAILRSLFAMRGFDRLNGLWVQWHGDGTNRAQRKDDVIVSVQYDRYLNAIAVEGRGRTVKEATAELAARLATSPSIEPDTGERP